MSEPAALDLAAIREACENATEGPWRRGAMPEEDDNCVVTVALSSEYDGEPYATALVESSLRLPFANPADLDFIVIARNSLPALVDALSCCRAERDALKSALNGILTGIERVTPALDGAIFQAYNHGNHYTPEDISIEAELQAARAVMGVTQ